MNFNKKVGFFRGLISLFKPALKQVGNSVFKIAKSDAAKSIAKTISHQALDTTINMSCDAIQGNDFNDSIQREMKNIKRTGGDIHDDIQYEHKRMKKPKKMFAPNNMLTSKTSYIENYEKVLLIFTLKRLFI